MNQLHPILFSTGSLHVEEISTCFKLAKEAGFDGIEIIIDRRRSTFNSVTLNRLSDQYNLPIKVIHNPFFMFLPDSPDSRNPIKVLNLQKPSMQRVWCCTYQPKKDRNLSSTREKTILDSHSTIQTTNFINGLRQAGLETSKTLPK